MFHPVPPDLEKSDGERLGDSSRVVDDEEEEPRSLLARPGRFVAVFRPSTFLAALSFRFAFLRFAPKEGATGTMRRSSEDSTIAGIVGSTPPPLSKAKRNETKRKRGEERRRTGTNEDRKRRQRAPSARSSNLGHPLNSQKGPTAGTQNKNKIPLNQIHKTDPTAGTE